MTLRHRAALRGFEPLEPRLAPAVEIVNPTTATFTDVDGDKATVKVSAGNLTAGLFTMQTTPSGDQLERINLSLFGFDGVNLTVSVKKGPEGDGFVNVGSIDSTGHDLGTVSVQGDLGMITAGDATTLDDPGVKSLSVRSLGRFGTSTGAVVNGDGTIESHIIGSLGALKVKGDVTNAWLHVTGAGPSTVLDGSIGAITIGGSLVGGSTLLSGSIDITGDIGVVKIGRDIQGSSGVASGALQSDYGKIKSVTLGGSLIGGTAQYTGQIRSGNDLGPVKIAGNVLGGSASTTGFIASFTGFGTAVGKMSGVSIGGSVIGGDGAMSGLIQSPGDIGAVKIGGDLRGGDGDESAKIDAGTAGSGKIASINIGGSVIGGSGDYDTLGSRGQIFAPGIIGAVKIAHDVFGGAGHSSGQINAEGGLSSGITIDGSVIGGSGHFSGLIASGFDTGPVKIGHDLQGASGAHSGSIGCYSVVAVSVGGSVIGGSNTGTGTISSNAAMGVVKIGRDLIGGSISGTSTTLTLTGTVECANRIASVTVGGSVIAGIDTSSAGVLDRNAAIRAGDDIGAITVKGSLIGNSSSPVIISARGQNTLAPDAMSDIAIKSLTIGGRVEFAKILAGFDYLDSDSAGSNGNASIGAVRVGGDWFASSISAGVQDTGSDGFADGSDDLIVIPAGAATDAIIARIASVTIKGAVIGAPNPFFKYGFTAQQIGSFKASGFTAILTAAKDDAIVLTPYTLNVTILEI